MRSILTAILLTSLSLSGTAVAQGFYLPNGGYLNVETKSLAGMRFLDVVRQSRDLSCGAAALATIVNYFYDVPVSEEDVINTIFEQASPEEQSRIGADGFSMLELKRHYERLGFVAGGFSVPGVESLKNLTVPAITLINVRGYNHFVVIKGVEDDDVLIADPAFGNLTVPMASFSSQWNKVILVAVDPQREVRKEFLSDLTLRARPRDLISISTSIHGTEVSLPGEF